MATGQVDIAANVLGAFSGTAANYTIMLIDENELADADKPKVVTLPVLDARYTLAGVDNSTPVTLAGAYNYLTLSGQAITLTQIDLTTDVTGALPIANGGSGQTTQQAAIDALTAVSGATNEHVLTKDTATGNAIFKASAGGGGSSLPVVDETAIVYKTGTPANELTLNVDAFTAARTWAFPDAASTFAGLSVAQTFTAVQTISSNVIISGASNGLRLDRASGPTLVHALSYNSSNNLTLQVYGGGSLYIDTNSTTRAVFGTVGVSVDGLLINNSASTYRGAIYFSDLANQVAQTQSRWAIVSGYSGQDGATSNLMLQSRAGITFLVDGGVTGGTANLKDNLWVSANSGTYNSTNTTETNTVDDVIHLRHLSTGIIATGFGGALRFGLQSSTTADQNAGRAIWKWTTATHATRAAQFDLTAYYTTTERTVISGGANSSGPLLGFYGTTPAAKQDITGSRGGNAALADLLTKLATIGLITDSTT